MMIRAFELGAENSPYFRNLMSRGQRLAQLVSAREVTRLYTLLPDSVEPSAISDFVHGGKLHAPPRIGNTQQIPNTDEELAEVVVRAAGHWPFAVVVLEDEIARPSDFAKEEVDRLVFEGEDVYHVIDREEVQSKEAFLNRLSWARSTATTRGFVAIFDQPIVRSEEGRWAPGDLQRISAHTRLAFQSAYDGESYLIAELR